MGSQLTIALPAWAASQASLTRLAAVAPVALAFGGRRRSWAWCAVALLATAAGTAAVCERAARPYAQAAEPWTAATVNDWSGAAVTRVTGWGAKTASGWRAPAVIVDSETAREGEGPEAGDGILLHGRGAVPAPGAVLQGALQAHPPRGSGIPGGFDAASFLAGRGLRWQGKLTDDAPAADADHLGEAVATWLAPARTTVLERVASLLPPAEAAVAGSVLLGVRTTESRELARGYAELGLAHLFAVSGLHVGILLGCALLPARLAGAGPAWVWGLALLLLPVYAALTGLPGSVVRAAGAAVLALGAPVAGRRADPLRLIGLLYWTTMALQPSAAQDVGVRLSYLAAGGILAAGRLTGGFRFTGSRRRDAPVAGLTVSLAAQCATLPVVASSFPALHALAPLVNVVAVPLFSLAVWLVAVAVAVAPIWPWAAESAAALGWVLLRGLAGGVDRGVAVLSWAQSDLPLPGAGTVWVLGICGVVLLAMAKGAASRGPWAVLGLLAAVYTVALGGLGVVRQAPPRGVEVWQFDVGQGDCGLVRMPDGWTALIDTAGGRRGGGGPLERDVGPLLRRLGIRRLDAVVLTHGHADHTAGSEALMEVCDVEAWFCGGRAEPPAGAHTGADAGGLLHAAGAWSLHLDDPARFHPEAHGENDRSLVLTLRRGSETAMVWTGDLETPGEEALLKSGWSGRRAQVWKAGHHGSATSGGASFLAHLQPGLVLISCGPGNRYDHPSHGPFVAAGDTLTVLRTDLDGTVRLRWRGPATAPGVRTWRP